MFAKHSPAPGAFPYGPFLSPTKPATDLLKQASIARWQAAQGAGSRERLALARYLGAVWSCLRALVAAVMRALGLLRRGHAPAAAQINSVADIKAQSDALDGEIKAAGPQLHQALADCGFNALAQSLLVRVQDPASLDPQEAGRLAGSVFATCAEGMTLLDKELVAGQQVLAERARPWIERLGGPPLNYEDVARILRQRPTEASSDPQDPAVADFLLAHQAVARKLGQRDQVLRVMLDFAARLAGMEAEGGAAVDLRAFEVDLQRLFGSNWREQIQAAGQVKAEPSSQQSPAAARSQEESNSAIVPAAGANRLNALHERLRAAAARAELDEQSLLSGSIPAPG